MSYDFEFYHGVALCRIIHDERVQSIKLYPSKSNSSYIVNGEIGVFIKYSSKRMTPWHFTVTQTHQAELYEMKELLEQAFIVLVCKDDGIACLDYEEFKALVGGHRKKTEWVSVRRKPREKYSVTGSHGELGYKIADNQYPERLFHKCFVKV